MRIKLSLALMASVLGVSVYANDAIYCSAGKVMDIQSQTGNVVVNISGGVGWKHLGSYSDPALPSRMSIALAAQASDKNVMLAFPLNSGVVCTEPNWNVAPYKVRISK